MKFVKFIPFLIFGVVLVILGITGFLYNNCNFFDIKLSLLLTLALGAIISFLLTNLSSGENQKKNVINDFLLELKQQVNNDKLYTFDGTETREEILIRNREIQMLINEIKKIDKKYIDKKIINEISDKFDEYQDLIQLHMDNILMLNKNFEVKSHLSQINTRINKLRAQLYNLKI